jgi:ABC-2 type transport system permease protein
VARTLRAAALIARIDLKRRLRNRAFLLQALVAPVLMSILISLAFGSGFGLDAEIGVVDQDGSALSKEVASGLLRTEAEGISFRRYDDLAAATDAVDDDEVGSAIVIPAGFQDGLAAPNPRPLGLVTDRSREVESAVARAVAEGVAARLSAGRLATFALLADGHPAPDTRSLSEQDLPIAVRQRFPGDEVSPAASVGPGIGLLFLFLSVAIVARSLYEEHRQRVLDRIRAAPVSLGGLLLGKAAGLVVLSCTTMAVLWGTTVVLLGSDWGDPLGVVALIVASAVMVAGLGAFVAGTVRNERSADLYAMVVAFVLGILGGSLVPLSELPDTLKRVTLLTPNGWALRGFAELSAGDGHLADVAPHIGVLLLWALACGAIGRRLLPKRLGVV